MGNGFDSSQESLDAASEAFAKVLGAIYRERKNLDVETAARRVQRAWNELSGMKMTDAAARDIAAHTLEPLWRRPVRALRDRFR